MFFLKPKFYIIFILTWIFASYIIFTKLHSTTDDKKIYQERIDNLQNEVFLLQEKIFQLKLEK